MAAAGPGVSLVPGTGRVRLSLHLVRGRAHNCYRVLSGVASQRMTGAAWICSPGVPTAGLISFRLGGHDGVSIEAAKWASALAELGWRVFTVAGSGPVDTVLAGLGVGAPDPPSVGEIQEALAPADLVIVENLCSLPLNPVAGERVAAACRGRPAILHHHDLPWERPHLAHFPPPPDDRTWGHVTVSESSRAALGRRGVAATTVYNAFDPDPPLFDRTAARQALGLPADGRLLLQPTRALPRKNVPEGLALAEALGATFWLLGPAEDGYGPDLDRVLAGARCPVIFGRPGPDFSIELAYAASDAVVLPSTWEGFGNPSVEAATHDRPLAIGAYPVAAELAALGFTWFPSSSPEGLRGWFDAPDGGLIASNHDVARRHFNVKNLPDRLAQVIDGLRTTFG